MPAHPAKLDALPKVPENLWGNTSEHARTNETKRKDFPVGLTPQPPIWDPRDMTWGGQE